MERDDVATEGAWGVTPWIDHFAEEIAVVDRKDPKPLSFGHGIHHCLSAALTRLEMRVAIPAFLDSFGDYIIDPDSSAWKQSNTLRGPTTLKVQREC